MNGADAPFVQSEVDGFQVLDVEFASRLRYGRTFTIVVSYRLLGDPPRTDDSFVRVNPAYVSFPVYAWADDGAADVRVELPDGWTPDYVGSDFDRTATEDGVLVLESTDIAVTADFGVLFTARQDDRLASTPLTVGDSLFEIRAWPGDADWLDIHRAPDHRGRARPRTARRHPLARGERDRRRSRPRRRTSAGTPASTSPTPT